MLTEFPLLITIAKNTYREIIREKLLYGVLLVALLVTGSSFFLATISFDQNSRVLENIGIASINLFTVFILIFVTTNSVFKDFERRALYLLFPKPISRNQYVIGKYLGLLLVLLTTLLILGGIYCIGVLFVDKTVITAIIINLAYSFLEISLVIAIAQLFASFAAPLNASLYTIALYIIGHALPTLRQYVDQNSSAVSQKLIGFCYYVLPNLEKFDVRPATLYHLPFSAGQVIWSILYGLIYIVIVIYLTTLVMKNREV